MEGQRRLAWGVMGLSQCRGSSRSKVCGHEGLGGLVGDCEWLVKGWPKGDCQRVKWAEG